MQPNLRLFALIAITAMSFASCKKTADSVQNPTDTTTELAAHADDQSQFSAELDAVTNDVNNAIGDAASFSGKINGEQNVMGLICDASVVLDTVSNPRKITITYNGSNCAGSRTRTGVVVLSMPSSVRWKDAGAVLTVDYQNLKITRMGDNKSLTINGTQTITNVTGGNLWQLSTAGTIIHTISSNNMSVKFDNNTIRTWQVGVKRTFTYNNGIVISTTGTHANGTKTNISQWGTNRFGHSFETAIAEPLVIRQDCDFRVTGGKVEHNGLAATAAVTFGLDATGNPTTCPGTGHYYYKLSITINGITYNGIYPY